MNEAFEKILERLEEMINPKQLHFCKCARGRCRLFYNNKNCMDCVVKLAKEIVKEVAEEFATGTNVGTNGWIACSERLPDIELEKERNERGSDAVFPVLATINKVNISGEKYTTVNRAFYGCYNNDKNFYNYCCDKLDVIAWQPLPECWKGENNG